MLFRQTPRKRSGRSKQEDHQRTLERAVAAWRDAEARMPAQRLSAGARANVRALARRSADVAGDRGLARLFLPIARLAAAATVPALILAVSFGWLLVGRDGTVVTSEASMSIEIRKTDGQAVFDIANGGRVHRVYKSTSARHIDGADLFATVEGGFRDTLAGEDSLVFYRID